MSDQVTVVRRTERGLGTAITIQVVSRNEGGRGSERGRAAEGRAADGRAADGRTAERRAHEAIAAAFEWVGAFERECSRFLPESALMRANAAPRHFHEVPPDCYAVIEEAHRAYEMTKGTFDPRVLGDLVRLGYERTFAEIGEPRPEVALRPRGEFGPWRPRFRAATHEVELGEHPIDLGGIGKGYAVRRMSALLTSAGLVDHVVEAGGDCACAGRASDGHPWMVGVEDPSGGNEPVAVLKLTGLACATSSTRTRRWAVAGRPVHHLIDASTGLPGGTGLDTVTVVHEDPVKAEIWSKSLLLAGRRGALALAERRRLAAVIIQSDGRLERSSAAERHMEWVRRVA